MVIEVKVKKLKRGTKQSQRMVDFSSLVFQTCGESSYLPSVNVVVLGEPAEGYIGLGTVPFIEKNEDKNVWIMYKPATETDQNFKTTFGVFYRYPKGNVSGLQSIYTMRNLLRASLGAILRRDKIPCFCEFRAVHV